MSEREGPISVMSCDGCHFLFYDESRYGTSLLLCTHPDGEEYLNVPGRIGRDAFTPSFCPYLKKKRKENK